MAPTIVPHPNTIRGPIESEYNGLRDAIEKKFIADQAALEAQYHADLADNQSDKEDALVAAGLNPDGGTPVNYGLPADNTAVPTITGTTAVGDELTAAPGTWTGDPSPTYAYQWQRANPNGSGVTNINGATSSTYTLVTADAGKKVRVKVTGTDSGGGEDAYSAYTATVGTVPDNTDVPTITGTTTVGEVLTATDGTWTGKPDPTFAYQWVRVDADGSNPVNIEDATDSTYTLVGADETKKVHVRVTGTNVLGNDTAVSANTATIQTA